MKEKTFRTRGVLPTTVPVAMSDRELLVDERSRPSTAVRGEQVVVGRHAEDAALVELPAGEESQ